MGALLGGTIAALPQLGAGASKAIGLLIAALVAYGYMADANAVEAAAREIDRDVAQGLSPIGAFYNFYTSVDYSNRPALPVLTASSWTAAFGQHGSVLGCGRRQGETGKGLSDLGSPGFGGFCAPVGGWPLTEQDRLLKVLIPLALFVGLRTFWESRGRNRRLSGT
jgi:hypothetical protein